MQQFQEEQTLSLREKLDQMAGLSLVQKSTYLSIKEERDQGKAPSALNIAMRLAVSPQQARDFESRIDQRLQEFETIRRHNERILSRN